MVLQLVTRSSEVRLTQMLADLRVQPGGWSALHFHLDRLLEEYKSEYQIKIAFNLVNDLLRNYDGHLFLMGDNSIMVLCNQLEPVVQEKLVFQPRYLYMDDPLSYTESGLENPDFVTIYDVKRNWQAFHDVCNRYMAMMARRQPLAYQPVTVSAADIAVTLSQQLPAQPFLPVLEKQPAPETLALSASRLAQIETTLRELDLQEALRRQPVCAVYHDLSLRRLYDEVYVNISHLRRTLREDVDFLSNRWLFRYITQILDVKMLELMRAMPGRYLDSPISLNLNVETLLSSRFAEINAIIPAANKVAIVIEVPVVDAFADMAAFQLALTEMQRLGYRICLDGMTAESFLSIRREQLGVDLIKVQWNGETIASTNLHDSPMSRAVRAAGPNRVILCRCDTKHAIEYGQALGVQLFQGRFIDSVLNPTSKIEN